jgi:rubrerythrin
MNLSLSPGELIKLAIGIERSAITFFDVMSRTTDADVTREIFEQFVEMEREHLKTFENMLTDIANEPAVDNALSGNSGYLQALIDDAVFTNDALMNEEVSQADSDVKALEVGIRAEKDSILFYEALKERLPQHAASIIETIVSDEKSHLQKLTLIKKQLETTR